MTSGAALPPLREVIARHDLRARKQLGQNFLLDGNLTAKIARTAGIGPDITAYEVGPGPGGLTRALLLAGAKQVVAVEKDPRCLAALNELGAAFPNRLTIVSGDALNQDEVRLLAGKEPVHLVANLPYNVATPLLIRWLTLPSWPAPFSRMTLMFQKEVAERIVAAPGTSAYGRLSVISQWRTRPAIAFDIPASAFVPPPKVTSSVVDFQLRERPVAPADTEILQRVTAAAFGQRRKMLRASLKTLVVDTVTVCEAAGIDPTRRAETLSVEEFCALARAISPAA